MTLWELLVVGVLLTNAAAVLHEERFLARYGWGFQQLGQSAAEVGALKYQAISAIHAATYFQLPLIFINSLVIVVKLLFG
jgi:hypothetical protein|mmetsp:Transcript_2450/g.7268  ORF Transcript_2450/g.7268 Transcript_2450/m.7268 type:complete len:80 (+) Transcript_2450:102-341(+)